MRIGIDLGGTKIEFIALSAAGSVLLRERQPTPSGDYRQTLEAIRAGVLSIESRLGETGSVGIGIPGTMSPATGLVKGANSSCLNGMRLDLDLENLLQREIRIANDANCFALSEAVDGAASQSGLVFGVILGTGTGGGLVIDGRIRKGPNAIAGEWGHNPLPWPLSRPQDDLADHEPRSCWCGKTGCIETWLSGPGLERSYRGRTGRAASAREIAQRALDREAEADAVLSEYEALLARALATVVNVIDPDAIVLGGGLSNIDRLYRNVPRLWQDWAFSDRIDTPLLPPKHGDSSGVRGAAWLWETQ
tara:strand:+ start:1318 stop:2235 length:918 start_codon:yes stop_codon:yes gene_type:complete